MSWFNSIEHNRWLSDELRAVLKYGQKAMVPAGFGYLNEDGTVAADEPAHLWITAQMVHAYSLGTLMGIPGSRRFADHGIRALATHFQDKEFGGWYAAVERDLGPDGVAVPLRDRRKYAYEQSYVMQAAAAATAANRPGALELLKQVMDLVDQHFWEEDHGMVRDSFDAQWSADRDYRSMDACLGMVRAFIATSEVMQERLWLERALRMLDNINEFASQNAWRIPEHFTSTWQPLPDHHKGRDNEFFRPYGTMIGHSMEAAALALDARAALRNRGEEVPEWLTTMAVELFERARVDAWRRDGNPGFAFTVDPTGQILIHDRLHWVVSAAIVATVAIRRAHLDDGADAGMIEHYEHCYRSWVDYLEEFIIVRPGEWNHHLDAHNEPIHDESMYWHGRPTILAAIQVLLAARLPLGGSMAMSLANGGLDHPEGLPGAGEVEKKKRRGFFHRS